MAENEEKDPTDESASSTADSSSTDEVGSVSDVNAAEEEDSSLDELLTAADESEELAEAEVPAELADEADEAEVTGDELVGAATGASTERASSGAQGRAKKDKPTPKQRQTGEATKRATPVQFVSESVGELRKVVYPTGTQLLTYFVVVLVFVAFIITLVSLLDFGFGWAIFKAFS